MGEVAKIVKQRLAAGQRAAGAGAHLDADLMAALAEKRLEGEERERALAHLAQCAECREVAVLSAPGEEATQMVVRPVRRRFWLFQPNVLRWGAVAASVVVVAIAVSLYRPKPQRAVSTTAQEAPAATAPAAANETRVEAQPSEGKKAEAVATLAPASALKQEMRAPAKEGIAAARATKDENEYRATAPGAAGAMAKAAPATAPTEAAGKAAEAIPAMMAEKGMTKNVPAAAGAPVTAERAVAQKAPAAAAAADQFALQRAAPAAARATAETVEVQAAAPAVQRQSEMVMKRQLAAARWSISNNGEVQVAHTGGAPWTTVAIAKGVRFRAVSTIGTDVWAGGSGGALYHSTDGGATWVRVAVGTTEDIVRVEFRDAQHGSVTTALGERWVTEDGGKSWEIKK